MPCSQELRFFSKYSAKCTESEGKPTPVSTLVSANRIILVDDEYGYFLQSLPISSEVTEVVPTHGVDVRLTNLLSKDGMMSREEGVEAFVSDECLLLDNLRVDVGRAQGFDLRDEEIPNPFYSLDDLQPAALYKLPVWINTLLVRSSNNGLTSEVAMTFSDFLALPSIIFDHRSNSSSAVIQEESIGPSEMMVTTAGGIETSSIAGPRSLSTTLRFSNLLSIAVDRDWRVSISADTAPRSCWKFVKEVCTDLRTSSQA